MLALSKKEPVIVVIGKESIETLAIEGFLLGLQRKNVYWGFAVSEYLGDGLYSRDGVMHDVIFPSHKVPPRRIRQEGWWIFVDVELKRRQRLGGLQAVNTFGVFKQRPREFKDFWRSSLLATVLYPFLGGAQPPDLPLVVPRRSVITDKMVDNKPQFLAEGRRWNCAAIAALASFPEEAYQEALSSRHVRFFVGADAYDIIDLYRLGSMYSLV